jgi:isoprenylcysteine carboxyl methyltransferase (ICMT) family protein YpbQ
MMELYIFIIVAISFRLFMLTVSVRHEMRLRAEGAVEFGVGNSRALALAHIAFYVAASTEGILSFSSFDALNLFGLGIYFFGAGMLLFVVRLLGPLWTVKLFIARNHVLVRHPLFRHIRHPNYYLNIVPELIGYALALHAPITLIVGLPIYALPLVIRIRQEERVMRDQFATY